jgi:mono/diheme cytochrome c family protein
MCAKRLLLLVLAAVLVVVLLFGLMQLVPFGRNHTNPPVAQEPAWDSPRTRELAVRACFDCHSNETTWPWYSSIAPVSWLVQRDVQEGRRELNFSTWGQQRERVREIGETVREGEMPPFFYVWMHPAAKLTAQEASELAQGLEATVR